MLSPLFAAACNSGNCGMPSESRLYMNLGDDGGGNWLGFDDPIVLFTGNNFCAVAEGDITGDTYDDLFFVSYEDSTEDQLLINDTVELIRAELLNAEGALGRTLRQLRQVFDSIGDEYLRVVKLAVEEFIELSGYFLWLIGTIEYTYQAKAIAFREPQPAAARRRASRLPKSKGRF